MGQMINCALKAVNFRAINSDDPLKQIAESCEKVKGKDIYLCFYLLQNPITAVFSFLTTGSSAF